MKLFTARKLIEHANEHFAILSPFPLGLTTRQALELVYHRAGLSRLEMPSISRWKRRENKVEVYTNGWYLADRSLCARNLSSRALSSFIQPIGWSARENVPSPCIILKRSLAGDITRDVSSACQLITCKCIIWTSGARSPTNEVSELQDTISPIALSIYLASNGQTRIPIYRLLRVYKYTREMNAAINVRA